MHLHIVAIGPSKMHYNACSEYFLGNSYAIRNIKNTGVKDIQRYVYTYI